MDGTMFALLITFTICFIIGFGGYYFETQNQKILEETKRSIERTNDLSMTYINDYYESNKLRMDEIEKTFLAEIACLATKNNNDIKEIKDKITTGKKSKRISQLIDENNMSEDTISRQAAIDATKKYYRAHDNDLLELIAFDIEQLPSAQPENIRCAECKWFQCNMRQDGYLPKGVDEFECRHWCGYCDPTDFCSYAERRTE